MNTQDKVAIVTGGASEIMDGFIFRSLFNSKQSTV